MARFDIGDKVLLCVTIILVITAAMCVRSNFDIAFPRAPIGLHLSEDQAYAKACQFLSSQNIDLAGHKSSKIFSGDYIAQLYLEKTLGTDLANGLMSGSVKVWYWAIRFSRKNQNTTYEVFVGPGGRIVGYHNFTPQSRPNIQIGDTESFERARRFLASKSVDTHRLIEQTQEEKDENVQHVFIWAQTNLKAGDAIYKRRVAVRGVAVVGYDEYLQIPENWLRQFDAAHSKNRLFASLAQLSYAVLGIAAIVILFLHRGQRIDWKSATVFASAISILALCNHFNSGSSFINSVRNGPLSAYPPLLIVAIAAIPLAIGVFIKVGLPYLALGTMKGGMACNLSFQELLGRKGVGSRNCFRAILVGYAFTAFDIIFIILFYLCGKRYGIWMPQEAPFSSIASTTLPFVYPIAVGAITSIGEEFWFRLFAIPLLKRFMPTAFAVVIPAVAWGYLHAGYPQEPAHVRAIELGILGIIAGALMLRYGAMATLVWHFARNALLAGIIMYQAGSARMLMSCTVVLAAILSPLIVSLMLYFKNGGFYIASKPGNNVPLALSGSIQPDDRKVPALAAKQTIGWPIHNLYLAAGVVIGAAILIYSPPVGSFIRIKLSRETAASISNRALIERGVEPAGWHAVTVFDTGLRPYELQYLRENVEIDKVETLIKKGRPTGIWTTRYYKPGRKDEWRISIDQEGRIVGEEHVLPEGDAGARLDSPSAKSLAEKYLLRQLNTGNLYLLSSREEKLKNRTDHIFTWSGRTDSSEVGSTWAMVKVAGEGISVYKQALLIPEAWQKRFMAGSLKIFVPYLILLGLTGYRVSCMLFRRKRKRFIAQWPIYWRMAILIALIVMVSQLLSVPFRLYNYDTAQPLTYFYCDEALKVLLRIMLIVAGFVIAMALADISMKELGHTEAQKKPILARVLAIGLLSFGLLLIFGSIFKYCRGLDYESWMWSIPGTDSLLPAMSVIQNALTSTVGFIFISSLLAWSCSFSRARVRFAILAIAIAGLALIEARNLPGFVIEFLILGVIAAVELCIVKICGRDILSISLGLFIGFVGVEIIPFISQSIPFMKMQGVFLIIGISMVCLVLYKGTQSETKNGLLRAFWGHIKLAKNVR